MIALSACGCGARSTLVSADGGTSALDSAASDTLLPDSSPRLLEGLIQLSEVSDASSGSQQGTVRAIFTPAPHPFFSPIRQLSPNCALYAADDTGPTQLSAGIVTIEGAAYGPIELEPEANPKPGGYLYLGRLFPELFSAGDRIDVIAAGGEHPAFSGVVRGVGSPKLFLPLGTIDRTKGETLQLGGLPQSALIWLVLAENSDDTDRFVRCEDRLDPDGRYAIRPELLAEFPAPSTIVIAAGPVEHEIVERRSANVTTRVHLVAAHLSAMARHLK